MYLFSGGHFLSAGIFLSFVFIRFKESNTMKHPVWLFLALILSLSLAFVASIWLGDGFAAPDLADPLFLHLRLPRVMTALLVGAALAGSGAALQALFRNPLADPALIGTSSGAALAVVVVIALGFGGLGLPLAAFVGALLSTALVLSLARLTQSGEAGLLLMGLVLGSMMGAITSLLMFLSDDLTLRAAMSWLAGHLAGGSSADLRVAGGLIFLGVAVLWFLGRDLDCLSLGTEQASALGLSPNRTRFFVVCAAALATGAAVSISGLIGFVGMMVPNALALILGGSRRRLIALSAWVGGLFLLVMDTVARSVAYPIDLPVGLLAALTGPPFFLWLFWIRQRRGL